MNKPVKYLRIILVFGAVTGINMAMFLEMQGLWPESLYALLAAAGCALILALTYLLEHLKNPIVLKKIFFGILFSLLLIAAFCAFVAGLVDMFRWSGDETVGALRVGGFTVAGFALLLASLWVKTRKLKPLQDNL
ncbi:MAG: hypothetical protein V1846_01745 [Candidatus Komeilibacteria bacterium]